ncbi:hypothetical protein A2U01_0107741, partial [Trifolium medium]|nr:hypothetical protein [Trifolium medium]
DVLEFSSIRRWLVHCVGRSHLPISAGLGVFLVPSQTGSTASLVFGV